MQLLADKLLFTFISIPFYPFFYTFLFYLGQKGLNLPFSVYITLKKRSFLLFRFLYQKGEKFTASDKKEGFGDEFQETIKV